MPWPISMPKSSSLARERPARCLHRLPRALRNRSRPPLSATSVTTHLRASSSIVRMCVLCTGLFLLQARRHTCLAVSRASLPRRMLMATLESFPRADGARRDTPNLCILTHRSIITHRPTPKYLRLNHITVLVFTFNDHQLSFVIPPTYILYSSTVLIFGRYAHPLSSICCLYVCYINHCS